MLNTHNRKRLSNSMTTDKNLSLHVLNTSSDRNGPVPIGFVLVYHQATVEQVVRELANNARAMKATSLDVHLPITQVLTELHRIHGIERGEVVDYRKLNLAGWADNTMLTLKVYPNAHYGLLLEAWDETSGAMYAHEAPIVPEEPSRIIH